ncbi:putative D-alanine--D-alanine ligase [Paratrimastix pyriformis]|uniref:D-alanine--D-alanine ligase n=1 Tax=Paratrimastix pyriformis TaxID=342808 RepID=A0ABQ8URX6_9EUKA|nr:putative D-alanine--D-alanine ligase [Paratrimastix pyriformis]
MSFTLSPVTFATRPTVLVVFEAPPEDGVQLTSDSALDEVHLVANALRQFPDIKEVAEVPIRNGLDLADVIRPYYDPAKPYQTVLFNMLENLPVQRTIGALCETMDLPVTDSTYPLGKMEMKAIFRAHGIRVPAGGIIPYGTTDLVASTHACLTRLLKDLSYYEEDYRAQALTPGKFGTLTVIAKNVGSDGSEGISQANVIVLQPNPADGGATYQVQALVDLVRSLQGTYHQTVLVEQFIEGREFNLSLLEKWTEDPAAPGGARREAHVLPLAEIESHPTAEALAHGFRNVVTYEAKWMSESHDGMALERRVPALNVSPTLAEELRGAALGAWHALGLNDYARVDIRVDSRERAYVLEANFPPCIDPDAGFPCALHEGGIAFPDFLRQMVFNAQLRASLNRQRISKVRASVLKAAAALGDVIALNKCKQHAEAAVRSGEQ